MRKINLVLLAFLLSLSLSAQEWTQIDLKELTPGSYILKSGEFSTSIVKQ